MASPILSRSYPHLPSWHIGYSLLSEFPQCSSFTKSAIFFDSSVPNTWCPLYLEQVLPHFPCFSKSALILPLLWLPLPVVSGRVSPWFLCTSNCAFLAHLRLLGGRVPEPWALSYCFIYPLLSSTQGLMPCIIICWIENKVFKSSVNQVDDVTTLLIETQRYRFRFGACWIWTFLLHLGNVQEILENRWTQEGQVWVDYIYVMLWIMGVVEITCRLRREDTVASGQGTGRKMKLIVVNFHHL